MNLWAWAELTAPHLLPSQVEIKPESYEVVFDYQQNRRLFKLFKVGPPGNFQERLNGLLEAVQLMLGDDFSVLVRSDGQVIFSGSRRTVPKARPEYTGVDFEAGRLVPSKPWIFRKEQSTVKKTP
jgi:hypothetical protein